MHRGRIIVLSLGLLFVAPNVALGWTQMVNEYPDSPTSCQNTATYPCIEWPTSGGLSVNVDVYLDSTLTLVTAVTLKTDMRNGFPQWNNIAARNPHLQETTSTANDEMFVRASLNELPRNVYAATTVSYQAASPHRIVAADMNFNREVSWNHSLDFSSYVEEGVTYYRADSRKVAVHELGHSEGLGHTGISPAVMRQGATTYWQAQANDKTGIISVYGAYP